MCVYIHGKAYKLTENDTRRLHASLAYFCFAEKLVKRIKYVWMYVRVGMCVAVYGGMHINPKY